MVVISGKVRKIWPKYNSKTLKFVLYIEIQGISMWYMSSIQEDPFSILHNPAQLE